MIHIVEQRSLTVETVTVTIKRVFDESPDFSWLGCFSNYRMPSTKDEKLVHRLTGSILDASDIWRDLQGHIVPKPEEHRRSREQEYTFHANGHEKLLHAYQDSQRLEALERGDWYFFGILAEVVVDGVTVGEDSLWGFESDGGESSIRSEEYQIAREAIANTHQWFRRRVV